MNPFDCSQVDELAADGADLLTPFRKSFRCSKLLLTLVIASGTINAASLYGYLARNSGKWGIHRVTGVDGVTLAAGSYHFVVENFGGYERAHVAYTVASGTPTVAAYLTEMIEGPTWIGD